VCARLQNIVRAYENAKEELNTHIEHIEENEETLNYFVNLNSVDMPGSDDLDVANVIGATFKALQPDNNLPLDANGTLTPEGVTMHQNTLTFYEKVNPVVENFSQNLEKLNDTFKARDIPNTDPQRLNVENDLILQVKTEFAQTTSEIQKIYQTQPAELVDMDTFNALAANTVECLQLVISTL